MTGATGEGKGALLIGSTGLVGRHVLRLLLDDPAWGEVRSFSRRSAEVEHARLTEHLVDFDALAGWRAQLAGDWLFSCLGTTRKAAGSIEAQRRVDYDYQFRVARAAAENGVAGLVLVSSSGADPESRFAYMRMKGELERDVAELGFSSVRILRPSILDGAREESRPGEKAGLVLAKPLGLVPGLRKYRPIPGHAVAQAALAASRVDGEGVKTYQLEELFKLARGG